MAISRTNVGNKQGPDTHDDPHKTGAARKAAQPLFVQKNHLKTIKSFSISDYIKYPITYLVIINYIQSVKSFYCRISKLLLNSFSSSNGKTDWQVITLCPSFGSACQV